jgi:hypothetical protein
MMIPVEKETLDKIVTLIEKRRNESEKTASEKLASEQTFTALVSDTAKALHLSGLTTNREKTAQELSEPNGAFKLLKRLAEWRQKYASEAVQASKNETKLGSASTAVKTSSYVSNKPEKGAAEAAFAKALGL